MRNYFLYKKIFDYLGVERGVDTMIKSTPIINCHTRRQSADLPPRIPPFHQNVSQQYDTLSMPLRPPPPSYSQSAVSNKNNHCNNSIASSSSMPTSPLQKSSISLMTPVRNSAPPPPYPGRIIVRF